jgi:nondiscriminating aspartyl-tRNA synthetase
MSLNKPNKMLSRTHFSKDLKNLQVGTEVRVAGWIEDFRDIGKLGFLTLRDITGAMQSVLFGDNLERAKTIPRQSSILIVGTVKPTKSRNFEVEVSVKEIYVYSEASLSLPIDPTGRIESNLDNRLDSRALDLRNPRVSQIFLLRSEVLKIIRDFFILNNFIEVNTPKIIGSASEGGSNLFEFDYFKRKGYLAQSPQLYKEQLVLSLDRVFEIAPYFRAENSHTVRHLNEFISVDVEAAYLDYFGIMDMIEQLVKTILKFLTESNKYQTDFHFLKDKPISDFVTSPFPRLSYEDCLKELVKLDEKINFGDDLPDSSLRKLGEKYSGFFFITDWPLELKPFYIHEHDDNPLLSKSFDLQFGYLELVSGGARQHDIGKLKHRLQSQGLSVDSFTDHLRTFEWGMPPHSGCGLGFDRLVMVLSHMANIREVVLYPRDTTRISP